MLATFSSCADLHRLTTVCPTSPVLGCNIIFGMSNNAVTGWDNCYARRVGEAPTVRLDCLAAVTYPALGMRFNGGRCGAQ